MVDLRLPVHRGKKPPHKQAKQSKTKQQTRGLPKEFPLPSHHIPLLFSHSALKKQLFIYFWLHLVFVAAQGLSLVAQVGLSLRLGLGCTGFSSRGSQALGCGLSSCGTWA